MEVSIFRIISRTTYHSKLFIYLFIYNSYTEVSIFSNIVGRLIIQNFLFIYLFITPIWKCRFFRIISRTTYHSKLFIYLFIYNSYMEVSIFEL